MASALEPLDLWQVTAFCSMNGNQVGMNVGHYLIGTSFGTGALDTDLLFAVDTAIATPYINALNNTARYEGVKAVRVLPKPLFAPVIRTVSAAVGAGGAVPLPSAVCGMLQYRTGNFGRTARGRMYIPFPSSTFLAAGTGEPSGAYQALVAAIGSAWASVVSVGAGGDTNNVNFVLYSRTIVPPLTVGRTFLITSAVGEAKWSTQHRRGDFGRINAPPYVVV